MIHVDRSRVPRPAVLATDGPSPAQKELQKAIAFFRSGSRERFVFSAYKHRDVAKALNELFHDKCAYCEARVATTSPVDIEMYRPKGGVLESPTHPGYWWLAMVWENLLASCADCNRVRDHAGIKSGKANRFPLIDESVRGFSPGSEAQEKPLLLDPCTDYPEQHLIFDVNGTVISDTPRGQTTISVLGLNRPALVNARRASAVAVASQIRRIERLLKVGQDKDLLTQELDDLRRMTDDREEFAGLKRQLIQPAVERWTNVASVESFAATIPSAISATRKRTARKEFARFETAQSSYSLKDQHGREKYRAQRRLIEHISIRDIRAIRELDLDLTANSGRTPWFMLLGENGTGKSTVLQATALALLGAEAFISLAQRRHIRPEQFVRYNRPVGSISVKLSGFPKPHALVFTDRGVEFTSPTGEKSAIQLTGGQPVMTGSGWEPQTVLLGYGATRLLPREGAEPTAPEAEEFSRVDNLFDPFVPLIDAEAWLLSLDTDQLANIKPILRDLLPLPADADFIPENGELVVVAHDAHVPLRRLSDGYQSVVAMTADILQVALHIWPNLQEAEGTVLLDEVGAHLHPTWKMRAVSTLRKALPAMQFLATTHDPLCLRGLGKGEVGVLQRGEDAQVISLSGLPSPADFRVDQLLTSDFFGMNSTIDPDVEALFDEYYALLALETMSTEQADRREALAKELSGRRYLGTTLRESLMYEAVDRLVAQHKAHPRLPVDELKAKAVADVSRVWKEGLR